MNAFACGIAGGVFAADNSDNWPGLLGGIGAGALVCGVIGYFTALAEAVTDVTTITTATTTTDRTARGSL